MTRCALGGVDGSNLNTAEVYDPTLNTWTPIAPMGSARYALAAVALNNKVYALGGGDALGTILNTAEVYDPALNTWSAIAPMGNVREGLAAVAL